MQKLIVCHSKRMAEQEKYLHKRLGYHVTITPAETTHGHEAYIVKVYRKEHKKGGDK